MFSKLLIVVAAVTLTGVALLGLRSERLALRHEITELHQRVERDRQRTWRLQVSIAERTQPAELHAATERAGLELEPVAPWRPDLTQPQRMARVPYRP